jgi:hypothetical protein
MTPLGIAGKRMTAASRDAEVDPARRVDIPGRRRLQHDGDITPTNIQRKRSG